jgi:signal transduction histidine kinase
MATTPDKRGRPADGIERLLARVDESGAGARVPPEARHAARARAQQLLEACDGRRDALPLVALGYAAELLCVIAVDLAANPRETELLIGQIEALAGLPRIALGREVLRTNRLLELPVDVAIEVQLALVLAFSDAESVSLWTRRADGEVRCVSYAGQFEPGSESARGGATALLEQPDAAALGPEPWLGLRIERLHPPAAALLALGLEPPSDHHQLLLAAAAPVLAALLDREALLAREHSARETVASSVERRLARLRFDLHDGPQQDLHLLAQDLSLFREQLRPMISGDPNAGRALGRLDDLEAQLVALDGDLRRLSTSVQSPFMQTGSLTDALAELTSAFTARTGVQPRTTVEGNTATLTDSQQITLLALVREALTNIRQHSSARTVQITIVVGDQGVRAEVTDDGSGFDPEATLVRAARAGRLGLVGMHERVRMLGGRTQIESRPGGPTVISATLPQWPEKPQR